MMQYNDKTMKNNWVSESSLGFNCQTPSARSKLEVDFTFTCHARKPRPLCKKTPSTSF